MSSATSLNSRHGTQRVSHLREVSNGSSDTNDSRPTTSSDTGTVQHDPVLSPLPIERKCILWVHDESTFKEEVVINLDIFPDVRPGDLMAIVAKTETTNVRDFQDKSQATRRDAEAVPTSMQRERSSSHPRSPGRSPNSDSKNDSEVGNRYMFIVKDITKEMKAKQPGLELSVTKNIADVFCLRHRASVYLTTADVTVSSASHVELSFRDEYLARSDMWRLTVAEMSNKTAFKGQKILFMGTIKAQVSCVWVNGRKVHSAFFSTNTKPIFRSESARYVLFIQMSREMWDFDSEGSGEIMFNKVVNGFLPALFKKWASLKAKHLVSIVLFTRVEYDTGIASEFAAGVPDNAYYTGVQAAGSRKPYKDFYRVVVSEMASGSWTTILYQLKREFKFFRKDISLHRINNLEPIEQTSMEPKTRGALGTRIEAEPSLAMYGNLLEAINLASSQFSHDYIDRDLMRTGISIVVITPCPGLFEVDYETLRTTTESLIGSGIGIDLVCLPKMPLHSVPLFRYRNPQYATFQEAINSKVLHSEDSTPRQNVPLYGSSFSSLNDPLSPKKSSQPERIHRSGSSGSAIVPSEWTFAIPHWIDVSFWTGASQDLYLTNPSAKAIRKYLKRKAARRATDFEIRCKMYEMEMASLTDIFGADISVPQLQDDALFPQMVIGPKEVLGKKLDPQQVIGPLQRKKAYTSFLEFVSGPSKSLIDPNAPLDDKRFYQTLDKFDSTKCEILRGIRMDRVGIESKKPFKTGSDEATRRILADDDKLFGTSFKDERVKPQETSMRPTSALDKTRKPKIALELDKSKRNGNAARSSMAVTTAATKPPKIGRQISLGKFGFGVGAPKAATPEIQAEHVSAAKVSSSSSKVTDLKKSAGGTSHFLGSATLSQSQDRPSSSHSETPKAKKGDFIAEPKRHMDELTIGKSPLVKPLTIRSALQSLDSTNQIKSRSVLGSLYEVDDLGMSGNGSTVQPARLDDHQRLYNSKLLARAGIELPTTLSPTTALSPWLSVLNPSNPSVNGILGPSQYTRWQHVFPKPIKTKTMKWKSLCSPASVPLTTEYFPSKNQLETEYQQKPYNISPGAEEDTNEAPKSRDDLLRELISLRLSQGFQIIVGSLVAEAFGQKSVKIADVFDRDRLSEDGVSVFMSMGNTIHQLSCVNETEIEVNMFVRKPTISTPPGTTSNSPTIYNAAIRTTLADDYESRPITLGRSREEYNWNYVDTFIAGFVDEMSENLRFWRARFVLIPVERPTQSQKKPGEDNEEEIRLEGIKKLTQMWQKHRVITPSERRLQGAAAIKAKDLNPLDIVYRTEDPSVVVTAELETLPLLEGGDWGPREGQLVEHERFRKSKLDIAGLAEAIQLPVEKGGVRMQNRRWHFRFHYNCFIGSDMTTWLMESFEDIETREEAVELGNKLMAKDELPKIKEKEMVKENAVKDMGIFVHVEKRHPFRDGQYFYQMTGEYAKQRPESRSGWFASRRRDASVPSTPMIESIARDSPMPERLRSSSNYDDASTDSEATTPVTTIPTTKRPKVALSKVMKYDVDHRKRSFRPERINLHYDRLHNPDNCYHIRIDWMGVTAKLIEDAIESWAAFAEGYGLRLVEAPIGEACSITSVQPFRSPYIIKLAAPPPAQQPQTYFDLSSFSPQPQSSPSSRHYYQKAIMRKFNFVLDIEAAQNFPANVDVTYSWGRPDFKYTQYIHRSGVILAEITDKGDFLFLANRLFNNRTMAARGGDRYVKSEHTDRSTRVTSSSAYGFERLTPLNSPMLRPTTTSSLNLSSMVGSPVIRAASDVLGPGLAESKLINVTTPESIKNELEAFCRDAKQLEQFYRDVLSTLPNATPPTLRSSYVGSLLDSNIPTLGLPPGILARDTSPGPMRLSSLSSSGVGPTSLQQFGRRPSVQIGASSSGGESSRQDSPRGSIADSEKGL